MTPLFVITDNTYLTICFCILFVIIFSSAFYIFRKRKRYLLKYGVKVEGVVFRIDREAGPEMNDRGYYIPVIRFETKQGEWITEPTQGFHTSIASHEEGDKVEVYYDPSDPKEFEIKRMET
jgi:hypothetical protein